MKDIAFKNGIYEINYRIQMKLISEHIRRRVEAEFL